MKYLSIFLDFLFPKNITCLICKRPIDPNNTYSLCKECFEELSFINEECYKCGKPIINKINIEKREVIDDKFLKEIEDNCIILTKNNESEKILKLKVDDDEEYILERKSHLAIVFPLNLEEG